MTVANNYAPIVAAANGVTTVFSGSWNAISAANIVVQLLNTTTGVYSPVSQGPATNQYVVTSVSSTGFVITFNTAPASGYNVVISRLTSPVQTVPYTTSRGFQGSVEETSFDSLTAMVQELGDTVLNSVQISVGDNSGANLVLPIASLRASTYLAFDASGNVIVSSGLASVPVSAAMTPVVEATTLPNARSLLSVGNQKTYNIPAATIGGSTNAWTASTGEGLTALVAGMKFTSVLAASNSTTNPTFAIDSIPATTVYKNSQTGALVALSALGDFPIGVEFELFAVDSTHLQLLNPVRQPVVSQSTNNTPASGFVGYAPSVNLPAGSAVNLTSGVQTNVTSLSLPAGDWDVWGNVVFTPTGAGTGFHAWTGTVSGTQPGIPNNGAYAEVDFPSQTTGGTPTLTVGAQRLSLPSTTTVYLGCLASFSTGACGAYGFMQARLRT